MLTSIITSIGILIIMISYIIYELIATKKDITGDITTAQESIYELESNSYYSQNDIESMIEDGISNLQYDVDDHANSISNLQDDTITSDELDDLKDWVTRGEDKILAKVKIITSMLDNLIPNEEIEENSEEKELIEQNRIDEILSVKIRTGRYTKREDGNFKLREQDEINVSLSNTAREELTETLMRLAKEDEFVSFNSNTYKGDKDEMGTKAPTKKISKQK